MDNYIIENIKSRRSVRSFQERPISKEVIEKIVEAGKFAPSALNRQPWKFIVIDDKKVIEGLFKITKARIERIYKFAFLLRLFSKDLKDQRVINALNKTAKNSHDTVFYKAPLLIFIANDTRFNKTTTDCHLAAQNMMLAAHSLGIGSCFVGRGQFIPKKLLQKKFSLPNFYDIKVHIAFGYPKEFPKTIPARKEDTIKWI